MPKVVDHEQRRHDIADALWRVAMEQGPTAISIRTVAAEAGWSTGALRHYFTTREELLSFAMEQATVRVQDRLYARAATIDAAGELLDRIAAFAEELLPLDEQRRAEFQLWRAFGEQSARDIDVATRLNTTMRGFYRQLIARLGGIEPPAAILETPSDDPWLEAWSQYLGVFVDGLATQLMYTPDQLTPDRARTVLREFLAAVPAREGEGDVGVD